jgi:hypothetical protein
MKRAQSAMEFVMITGAVMFFFVSFISLIHVSIEKKNYEKKDIALMIEAEYLADEIALAHEAGAGYERNFTLPQTVLGSLYSIEILENSSIYVHTLDMKHAMSISTLEVHYKPRGVSAEDRYAINISAPSTIKNINGIVNISSPFRP